MAVRCTGIPATQVFAGSVHAAAFPAAAGAGVTATRLTAAENCAGSVHAAAWPRQDTKGQGTITDSC